MAYKRILLATDFSPLADEAARRAVWLAATLKAELTLLHIVEHFPEDIPAESIAPENIDPATFYQHRAERRLTQLAHMLHREDAPRHVVLSTHSAKHAVIDHAREHAPDLIVIGAHGDHDLGGLLGGTATTVTHKAPCDVLVVRPQ